MEAVKTQDSPLGVLTSVAKIRVSKYEGPEKLAAEFYADLPKKMTEKGAASVFACGRTGNCPPAAEIII
jgi:hypothetical protein